MPGPSAAPPNPFRRGTSIQFETSRAGVARLEVYDVGGRLVRSLLHRELAPGPHALVFDGLDDQGARLASGIYLLRLSAGGETRTRRAVLLP